jgi:hypothetical protein
MPLGGLVGFGGSTPIITAAIGCPFPLELRRDPVAGMPNSGSVGGRTSFEPRHGKSPTGRHIDLKPGQAAGRRFGSQPTGPLKRYDQHRSASRNN